MRNSNILPRAYNWTSLNQLCSVLKMLSSSNVWTIRLCISLVASVQGHEICLLLIGLLEVSLFPSVKANPVKLPLYQLWKNDPKSALEMGANGCPWWWNWLERQLPSGNANKSPCAVKDIKLTPPRAISEHKPSPTPLNNINFRRLLSDYDNHESASSVTPMSTKSAIPTRVKKMHTPSRTPPMNSSNLNKYSRVRARAANYPFDIPLKDDDSLTSCPPFSVPHYMAQTASASAKARANSNPKERNPEKQSSETKKRFFFPLTPNIWSSKWSKGSGKDSTTRKEVNKHESVADHISVDSTVSMPAVVGRRPFNRFV